ncbi:MAG TPA: HyaD/HybD family hydrogenase maturation endopeptidase [Gemmatimonadales bacterium]
MIERRAGTVVIGLGNPLMRDDGIGLAALERLARRPDLPAGLELVDGGTWGMNLLPLIESAGAVVFLDAIRLGAAPGTVHELEGDAVPRRLAHKLSPHQIDLGEVLAIAMLRGTLPPRLRALGIEPAEVEMGAGLSPEVEAAMPELLARVVPACTS